ncbi:MAG: hypothetical protein ACKVP4_07320 [Hyphomicrobium sp.]
MRPLLTASGPRVILGSRPTVDGLAQSIVPGRAALFGPRCAVLNPITGALAVSDTGHHRLLIWRDTPERDYADADLQIGQKDFASEGRNGKAAVGRASLNVPTGVATDGKRLAVADAWNHRVLIWSSWPDKSNQPADLVLGQKDFTGGEANRGAFVAGADTLNWCYGVSFIAGGIAVADTGNRRVLFWNHIPTENGQPADVVLGQSDFTVRDEGAGQTSGPIGMRWPHAIADDGARILVADAGNNRIMAWERGHVVSGAPCSFVLGQKDAIAVEHNRGRYLPDERALNMPYGLCVSGDFLIATDTANSRVVGWSIDTLGPDAPASALSGQPHFGAKGDNRWRAAERDSVCWPYTVTAAGGVAVIADSGNNRVLLWEVTK